MHSSAISTRDIHEEETVELELSAEELELLDRAACEADGSQPAAAARGPERAPAATENQGVSATAQPPGAARIPD